MSQQSHQHHQFNLFGFQKPRAKVPISKEQIEQAKQLHAQGKFKDSADLIRDVRYKLEEYLKRIR